MVDFAKVVRESDERKKKAAELKAAAAPLMKYLADNHHPHTTAIVTAMNTEVMEGVATTGTTSEFLKD